MQQIELEKYCEKKNHNIYSRLDIKSFYKSIEHFKLIKIIKENYNDPKVVAMLENIITNPIEIP